MQLPEVDAETGKRLLLPAIYKAINEQNSKFESLTLEAFRQLFLTTASGKYLIRLGAQEGFTVPQQSGLGVDAFRQIVPAVVSYPKQISDTIVRLMGIFYDKSLVSPSFISTVAEPFNFQDKDTLLIRTDRGDLSIGIFAAQVSDISNVKATEFAGIVNASQSDVFADTSYEKETSKTFIRLTSKTYGAGAFIQIVGGTAQNVLRYPPVVKTQNTTGTVWNVEKKDGVEWTDITKFTWNGVGDNPNVYLVKVGDFVTFRGLESPFDVFVGTYIVEEVGYDYFIIRNERFLLTSASLVEPAPNTIVFTSNKKSTIIQNKEYCLVDESNEFAYSMFVSAVPSVVKRKLRGAGFVHGWQAPIVSFTRDSMVVRRKTMESMPNGENQFLLSSDKIRYDATRKFYRTLLGNDYISTATFLLDDSSEGFSVLPYTVPTSIAGNPIYGEIGENTLKVVFPHKHGLLFGWGFNLDGFSVPSTISSALVNKEHQVKSVLSDREITFEIDNGRKRFVGIPWAGNPDVFQVSYADSPYDFYMVFPDETSRLSSGLEDGMTFRISFDGNALIPGKESIGGLLSSRKCQVFESDTTTIYFKAGIGTGNKGQVLNGASGVRSGFFGGDLGTWYLNQTSDINQRVLSGLLVTFQNTSPSINSKYLGAYTYDTNGTYYKFVVGGVITYLKTPIIKGDNLLSINVSDASQFPFHGHIILDYGTDTQEGPIPYINIAVGQIILDPSYVFKKKHDIDAQVQVIRSIETIKLGIDGNEYPLYVTGTTAAREFLFSLVRQIVAAGVFVNTEVNYPPLKFVDPSLFPYS
jgi:hypothetical protein